MGNNNHDVSEQWSIASCQVHGLTLMVWPPSRMEVAHRSYIRMAQIVLHAKYRKGRTITSRRTCLPSTFEIIMWRNHSLTISYRHPQRLEQLSFVGGEDDENLYAKICQIWTQQQQRHIPRPWRRFHITTICTSHTAVWINNKNKQQTPSHFKSTIEMG